MSKSYWFGDEDQMGNFSNDKKDTFDPKKRYVGIRLQQGVPLLDRDWNELEDIRRYEEQMLRKWYIGDGSPDDGFKIMPLEEPGYDFMIKAGRCLKDGLEAVNDSDILYSAQEDVDMGPDIIKKLDEFSVYLDIWIEEVRQDGDHALANEDDVKMETCVRHKLRWRVGIGNWDSKAHHHYYPLAWIKKKKKDPITEKDIIDSRITVLTLQYLSDGLTTNRIADSLHRHSKLVAGDGSPDPALTVDKSGNVGIGTADPKAKLDVRGDISLGWTDGGGPKLLLTSAPHTHYIRANNWWTEFVSHPNEGWKFISSDVDKRELERVRITSSGNVGIGTAAPSRTLHVEGNEIHSGGREAGFSFADRAASELVENPTNGERWLWYSKDGIAHLWSEDDKLSVDKDGNLTTTGAIRGNIRVKDTRDVDTPPSGFNQEVSFDLKKKSAVGLDTDELSGMMTLAPDSAAIPDHQLNFNGDGIFWRKSFLQILALQPRPGAEIKPSATIRWGSWQKIKTEEGGSSDQRFKTEIMPLTNVLDKLDNIRGISFEWNDLYESLGYPSNGGRREIGLIAQEVEAAFPELVTSHGDEKYRILNYERLTAVLVEAVKELRAEVEALKRKINS